MNRKRREAHVRRAMAAGCARPVVRDRTPVVPVPCDLEIPASATEALGEPKEGTPIDATA